jgi:hypothetical protein
VSALGRNAENRVPVTWCLLIRSGQLELGGKAHSRCLNPDFPDELNAKSDARGSIGGPYRVPIALRSPSGYCDARN